MNKKLKIKATNEKTRVNRVNRLMLEILNLMNINYLTKNCTVHLTSISVHLTPYFVHLGPDFVHLGCILFTLFTRSPWDFTTQLLKNEQKNRRQNRRPSANLGIVQ